MPAAIEDARPPASICGISHETSLLSAGTGNGVEDTKNRGVWRQALCNLVIGVVYTYLRVRQRLIAAPFVYPICVLNLLPKVE